MAEYTQENSVILNIYHIWETVTNPYENSSLVNITKINKQDNMVLANIPYSFNFVIANLFIANNLQNNSVKANITISFNNSAIANIIGGYNFLSLANILKIPTQNNSALASLLTAIANNSVISNIQIAKASIPSTVKNITLGFDGQPGVFAIKSLEGATTTSGSLVTASGIFLKQTEIFESYYTIASGEAYSTVAILATSSATMRGMEGGGIGGTSPTPIIFGIPLISAFDGDPFDSGNPIPYLLGEDPGHFSVTHWMLPSIDPVDNTIRTDQLEYYCHVFNKGDTHTIYWMGVFRSIIEDTIIT